MENINKSYNFEGKVWKPEFRKGGKGKFFGKF